MFLKRNLSSSLRQLSFLEKDVCILVNEKDQECGVASKKLCMKHSLLFIFKSQIALLGHYMPERIDNPFHLPLHRAFSIFLFSPAHGMKMLLQRRAQQKLTFPGLWTNTCCSHPLQSDPSLISAMQRKLQDELGIPEGLVHRKTG